MIRQVVAAVADALKAREYLRAQASALVRLGDEFGDNAGLREAIEVLEAMPAGGDGAKDPHDWAATQNNLGTALAELGVHPPGVIGSSARDLRSFFATVWSRTRLLRSRGYRRRQLVPVGQTRMTSRVSGDQPVRQRCLSRSRT